MRTVAWMMAELAKFPADAVCFAYEGEVTGLVIETRTAAGELSGQQGVIHCSEDDDERRKTELLPLAAQSASLGETIGNARDALQREIAQAVANYTSATSLQLKSLQVDMVSTHTVQDLTPRYFVDGVRIELAAPVVVTP
jgi:hypothetical protein